MQEKHCSDCGRGHEATEGEEKQKQIDHRTPVQNGGQVLQHDLNFEAQVQVLEVLAGMLGLW